MELFSRFVALLLLLFPWHSEGGAFRSPEEYGWVRPQRIHVQVQLDSASRPISSALLGTNNLYWIDDDRVWANPEFPALLKSLGVQSLRFPGGEVADNYDWETNRLERRGFCPSCGARRMAESAALLVDEVFPEQPVRQWVLSFPYPLRFLFAHRSEILGEVLGIVYRVLATHLIRKAGFTRDTAHTGAVTLVQRFGSALNLNIHRTCCFWTGVCGPPRRVRSFPVGPGADHARADTAQPDHRPPCRPFPGGSSTFRVELSRCLVPV